MNREGESHHEQTHAKSTRREIEDQAKMERKEDRNVPGEEGDEIKNPKRKVIRVEFEETQDYVREQLNLSREEAEEISFVPSANLCQQCYKELTTKGEAPLTKWQSYAVEKKAHRGRLWRMLGKDPYIQGMWEYFSFERLEAKRFMKETERKAGRDTRPVAT